MNKKITHKNINKGMPSATIKTIECISKAQKKHKSVSFQNIYS